MYRTCHISDADGNISFKMTLFVILVSMAIGAGSVLAYNYITEVEPMEADLGVYTYDLTETSVVEWHTYSLSFEAPSDGTLSIMGENGIISVWFIDKDKFDVSHTYITGPNKIEFVTTEKVTGVNFTYQKN